MLVLIAAALIAAPRLLDLPAVKKGIERRVSQAVQGQVAWEALDVRLFPFPRGVLHHARIAVPDTLAGSVERIQLDLRLLPLLRGRAEIRTVTLLRPVLELQVRASTAPRAAQASDPISAYRQALAPVMTAIKRVAPDMTLTLQQGRVELRAPGLPPMAASEVDLRVETDANGVQLAATAAGDHWDRLQFQGRVEFADLRANATVDARGAKLQTVLDRLLSGSGVGLVLPSLSAHLQAHTDGSTSLDATLDAGMPSTRLLWGEKQLDLGEVGFKSALKSSGASLDLVLTDVHLGDLVPSGRASLRLAGSQREVQGEVEIDAVDLSHLRVAALTIAGDRALVRDYASRVHAGQVNTVRVSIKADSVADLVRTPRVDGSLTLAGGQMQLPVLEQMATEIGGQVEWAGNALRVRQATARLGGSRLTDTAFEYALGERAMSAQGRFDLDLTQSIELTRHLVSKDQRAVLENIERVRGRAQGSLKAALRKGQWSGEVSIAQSDCVLQVRNVPWPISLQEGHVAASPERLALSGWSGSLGASRFAEAGAELPLRAPLRLDGASGQATLVLEELYPWLRSQAKLAKELQSIEQVAGRAEVTLHKLQGRLDQPEALAYDISLQPQHVRVETGDLPGPTAIDQGSVRVTPDTLSVDGVGVALLDSTATLSGKLVDYRSKSLRIEGSVSAGVAGKQLLDWIWHRVRIPARVQPVTPLRFAAERVRWSDAGVDLAGSVQFEAGPRVGVDLGLHGGTLELRRLSVKDHESDAVVSLATRRHLLDVGFAGMVTGRTIASMLTFAQGEHPGRVTGDLRITFDLDQPGASSARGRLTGGRINLGLFLPVPVKLERIDLEADGSLLRVHELTVDWAEQKATMRGEISRGPSGPVIHAELASPGIVLDALLPARSTRAGAVGAEANEIEMNVWPLPVTGTVAVQANFLEFQRFRVQPVRATLVLEQQQAELKVAHAALCGVAFPFSVRAVPEQMEVAIHLSAKNQDMDSVARCFTEERLLMSGRFDIVAELTTKGSMSQLTEHLTGPVELDARDGEVRKSNLLTKILALKSIAGKVKPSGDGFDYEDLRIRGRFGGGKFSIDEALFDSPVMGLAATGTVGLSDYRANVALLVAPFGRLDRLVRKVPILGYVIGGTLTSIPVGVSGDVRDPLVVPLGPAAVTSELVGILERTFKLPAKLLQPGAVAQPAK